MRSPPQLSAETFINKWWTNPTTSISIDIEEWMETSYTSPEQFWKDSVFSRQEKVLPPSESIFGKSYNFYHDCIFRHVKSNKIAFSTFENYDNPENWTYERIHQCVNFHIEKWSSFSPQPKQTIAIVGEPNIYFVISLLAALRLGLTIYYLPTNTPYLGNGKLIQFLSKIKPNFIAAEDPFLSIDRIPLLTVNVHALDEENHIPQSYAYSANSEVNIALSLQENDAMSFNSLEAQTIYLHALRDGFFTLNLIQNSFWSSPLACPIRSEPFSTITSLLCGATRVHVPDDLLRSHPKILENERIHLLGFSGRLVELWTRNPGVPSRYLKYSYKSPLELSYQRWKTFAQINQIEKVPTLDLLFDNSSGGIPIFSRPSLEPFNVFFKPALGITWKLTQMNGSQEPSPSGFGLFNSFSSPIQKERATGNLIATKVDSNLILTGCKLPCREGITYPINKVEEDVNALSFVEVCMVYPTTKIGYPFSHYFVLLVFVNPKNPEMALDTIGKAKEIEKTIAFNLGSGYLPDKIEFFPLVPKMNLLGIDRNWCANQYRSGMLAQKKNLIQYNLIGMLKKLTQQELNSSQMHATGVSK